MLTKQGVAITFYAFYVNSTDLDGETGLTVTVDVNEGTTGAPIVTGASATELANGVYYYTLASGSVDADAAYVAVFKTASADVVQKWLPAMWQVGTTLKAVEDVTTTATATTVTDGVSLANDAITSAKYDESTAFPIASVDSGSTELARTGADGDTLETLSDQIDVVDGNVDSILLDTGTDGVVLADDAITSAKYDESTAFPVKSADTGATEIARTGADSDTLETLSDQIDGISVSGASAAEVWAYTTRTLTQSAASIATALSGSTLTILRGDTLTLNITGLGDISTRSKLWFTIKTSTTHEDASAIIQIEESAGLVYLNGTAASVAGNGSITVSDAAAGDITITLAAAASDDLVPQKNMRYDVQQLTAAGAVETLTSGTCHITADVTRRITG